jgi:hypothetical protein
MAKRDRSTEAWRTRHRRHILKRRYGITPEDFEEMAKAQKYRCRICGRREVRLCVDHNHKTGRVRALLCDSCNF